MKWLDNYRIRLVLVGFVTAIVLGGGRTSAAIINQVPIADAGLPRYVAQEQVVLDGTDSYDPNDSGPLSYAWRQISGPSVVITDSNTATPTISGFVQTDEIQECEFELVVNTGEQDSEPDTVKVVIVPTFVPGSIMVLENESFDPNKPTFIWFDGASESMYTGGGPWNSPGYKSNELWEEKANIISFNPYFADPGSICGYNMGEAMVFSRCADQIIVYLSAVAPNYCHPIQTAGLSLGGIPAIDVALRLNQTYADARYAINHVSFLDATTATLGYPEYSKRVADFLANPVDGEQCWLDSYDSAYGDLYPSALNVEFVSRKHIRATQWYHESLYLPESHDFNGGVVAGAYWSVIGPGKNLQLASTPDVQTYKFKWYGIASSGYMDFYYESNHPGRLPEPVTLIGPLDVGDPSGAVFTCKESENAIGYQLLFGSDPYRVMDYNIISDTSAPPNEVITTLPFEETWWTVRAYDQSGSTIYADPICIKAFRWKMDETVGNIAHDSFGVNDGICNGEPVWQPDGGMVAGALEFDGIDDYISIDFVLNPSLGAFTVLAWIKGGAPGQVIISQSDGTGSGETWLGVDAVSGCLMTGLVPPRAGMAIPQPLVSESIINDDQWHHIGFVWDGSYRILYVNGIEVAKDKYAKDPLKNADGGLYIGTSKTLDAGTFFSGLIDDIRIYDVALSAEEIVALP